MSERNWTPEPWSVRKWDGEDWPEKRFSLAGDKNAVAISPRYGRKDTVFRDLTRAATCVNACTGAPETIQPGAVVALAKALQEVVDDGLATNMTGWQEMARAALALYRGEEW